MPVPLIFAFVLGMVWQEEIRQYSCVGMAKAYGTHISRAWLPADEYQYGVGGKKATARSKGKGKGRKNPVS